jgi:transposase
MSAGRRLSELRHRGHVTRAGNHHARRLLIQAAWHYRSAPRRPPAAARNRDRASQAQICLCHRHLTAQGKRSTVVTVAVARELAGVLWAELTGQPPREASLAA